MKQFACGAVVPGCVATFQASDEAGILRQVVVHAHEDHGLTDISDELAAQVRAHIVAA